MSQIGDCVSEAGFSVKLLPTGDGLQLEEMTDTQFQDYLAAMETCKKEYGDHPPGIEPLTSPEDVGHYYDLLIEQRACLSEAGFPVNEMSSRETWIASYLVGGDDAPLPLAARSGIQAAEEACPPPTLEDIYGF